MANKQTGAPAPLLGHLPTTVAEIRKAQQAISAERIAISEDNASIYRATLKGIAPPRPLTDHDRLVTEHIKNYMNGATPAHLLIPAVSREAQNRAHIDALDFVSRHLARQEEIAAFDEAQAWVVDNSTQWRALCRDILLTAVRLASLEEKAREMLLPISSVIGVPGLAMATTIGSGFSILGIGDPLRDMRDEAVKQGIVSESDIRKAEKC